MASALQCPKCELLFVAKTQLDFHCREDHPDFRHVYLPSSEAAMAPAGSARSGAFTAAGEAAAKAPAPGPADGFHTGSTRHVLVVANRTLGGSALVDWVRTRASEGPCDFSLIVPATGSHGTANGSTSNGSTSNGAAGNRSAVNGEPSHAAAPTNGHDGGGDGAGSDAAADSDAAARQLRLGLARLREVGVDADGTVGAPDPMTAVRRALAGGSYDEVIVSVLPSGVSRWWRQRLPGQVQRLSGLPVTVVVAREPDGS